MFVALILCLSVLAAELLARHTRARPLGAALLVILVGLALANLGVIPTHSAPAYEVVFAWVAPLSIFWLLLQVELRRVFEAGIVMIGLFVLGSVGTIVGALIGMWLIGGAAALAEHAGPVAGMFVGTYVGGSLNFNAIALHYGVVEQGVIYAGAVVVDNVLSTVWMVATLLVPKVVRRWLPARSVTVTATSAEPIAVPESRDRELLDPTRLAAMLAFGLAAVLGAEALADFAEAPMMLILTVIALFLAQTRPLLGRIGIADPFIGARALGMFAVYLFLAVVGAHADLAALASIGPLGLDLTILAATTILVHGLIVFAVGLLLRLDVDVAAVASQANIGGGTTALALARGLERDDLVAPGILVGALGTALGTFVGFWVAGLLA